ncbi:hypothetical protein [Halalkalibacter lacteus]
MRRLFSVLLIISFLAIITAFTYVGRGEVVPLYIEEGESVPH